VETGEGPPPKARVGRDDGGVTASHPAKATTQLVELGGGPGGEGDVRGVVAGENVADVVAEPSGERLAFAQPARRPGALDRFDPGEATVPVDRGDLPGPAGST
jgi:hypothetical protein